MGVSVYSYNAKDPGAIPIRKVVYKIVMAHPYALQVHGFYVDRTKKEMRFDVVVRFGNDLQAILQELHQEVQAAYPDYHILIDPDMDISAIGQGRHA